MALNDELMDSEMDADATDFFDEEIARYVQIVDRDPDEALQRYGFTLYHSLPGKQAIAMSQKLGFYRNDAVDQYNQAGLAINNEDYAKAAKLLQKTLDMDGTIADAAYNLALCLEKLDRKSDAISAWSRYQELSENEEEARMVEAHLAELKG